MGRPRVYDGCGRKHAFATETEAMAWPNPLGLRIYQCTTCQKWHHTKLTLDEFQVLARRETPNVGAKRGGTVLRDDSA